MNTQISLLWVPIIVAVVQKEPSCLSHEFASDGKCQLTRSGTQLLAVHKKQAQLHGMAGQSKADAKEWMDDRMSSAHTFRIFCFAWTPRQPNEELLVQEIRAELEMCDGHAFFTDVDAPGEDDAGDWIRVQVPSSGEDKSDPDWLKLRDMVALAPVWARIFEMDLATEYDWIMHVEPDHFVNMEKVRRNLVQNLDALRSGSEREQSFLDGSILLNWGNAFLFNSNLVRDMAAQWGELGATCDQNCPVLAKDRAAAVGFCEHDMIYPWLDQILHNGMLSMGDPGCGHSSQTPDSGQKLPLSCWQDMALVGVDFNASEVIETISSLQGADSMQDAQQRCDRASPAMGPLCTSLYRAVDVPIMHLFKSPGMHTMAQQLFLH